MDRRRFWLFPVARRVVSIVACASAVALGGTAAFAAPGFDLIGELKFPLLEIGDVSQADFQAGCAGGATDRLLLRFELHTVNIGDDDVILGAPDCPNCFTNPGAVCNNPLFFCSPTHRIPKSGILAFYEFYDEGGQLLTSRDKPGVCLVDTICDRHTYTCGFQGLTSGCTDVYNYGTPCQYLDLTDVDPSVGTYTLRAVMDPDGIYDENDETNNVTTLEIELTCANTPAGTRCDDGQACTVDDRCGLNVCSGIGAAVATQLKVGGTVTGGGFADDRVRVRARFPDDFYTGDPVTFGADVAVRTSKGESVVAANLDAAGWRDVDGRGRKFVYRDDVVVRGVHVARLKHRRAAGVVRTRVKARGLDLASVTESDTLVVNQRFGHPTVERCLDELVVDCASTPSGIGCTNQP